MNHDQVLEGFLMTCSFDYLDRGSGSRAYILAMCVGVYVLPLLLIGFAYASISWKVRASRRFLNEMFRSRSSHSIARSAVVCHNGALLRRYCPELRVHQNGQDHIHDGGVLDRRVDSVHGGRVDGTRGVDLAADTVGRAAAGDLRQERCLLQSYRYEESFLFQATLFFVTYS
ncbi:hypothetical protein BV898_19682 [Hypsibius exemplaris]|uniref:G-protein coupled receptors family 1 profile domain-containing protein n=1 Tax=Hypsibius exemplaris TaxID=2072580 RepID=A0A9X6NSM1_HYPEX|nr:hypothetical protein BV898_19682 [Hypsibius exemplaris]